MNYLKRSRCEEGRRGPAETPLTETDLLLQIRDLLTAQGAGDRQ